LSVSFIFKGLTESIPKGRLMEKEFLTEIMNQLSPTKDLKICACLRTLWMH